MPAASVVQPSWAYADVVCVAAKNKDRKSASKAGANKYVLFFMVDLLFRWEIFACLLLFVGRVNPTV